MRKCISLILVLVVLLLCSWGVYKQITPGIINWLIVLCGVGLWFITKKWIPRMWFSLLILNVLISLVFFAFGLFRGDAMVWEGLMQYYLIYVVPSVCGVILPYIYMMGALLFGKYLFLLDIVISGVGYAVIGYLIERYWEGLKPSLVRDKDDFGMK